MEKEENKGGMTVFELVLAIIAIVLIGVVGTRIVKDMTSNNAELGQNNVSTSVSENK